MCCYSPRLLIASLSSTEFRPPRPGRGPCWQGWSICRPVLNDNLLKCFHPGRGSRCRCSSLNGRVLALELLEGFRPVDGHRSCCPGLERSSVCSLRRTPPLGLHTSHTRAALPSFPCALSATAARQRHGHAHPLAFWRNGGSELRKGAPNEYGMPRVASAVSAPHLGFSPASSPAQPASFPDFIEPCLAFLRKKGPAGARYVHELSSTVTACRRTCAMGA